LKRLSQRCRHRHEDCGEIREYLFEPFFTTKKAGKGKPPTLSMTSTTILLVEDEEPLRAVVARMLVQAGYRVLDARTPTEARDLFERHKADIALLLTDVVMPEMNGPALAHCLVAQRPELRVLFVSGYTEELPVLDTARTRSKFLAKPFTSAALLATVAELIEPQI
jgi:two-component system cell cycle sensor histidine kinase/response regulator CckA